MINTLVLTVKATAALTAYTVCRFSGGYSGTTPYLGVVLSDSAIGDLASVTVLGVGMVTLADGESVTVGEVLGIDATGKGVANDSEDKVADFKPVFKTDGTFAYVLLT